MTRFMRDALITVIVLAFVAVVVAYASVAGGGLSAETPPGRIERAVAGRLVRLSIPPDAASLKNPYAVDADTWRDAADHYGDHCATCHGADGRGRTDIGEYMYPKVPDLAGASVQSMSDGALFYVIQNGVRWTGMPGWKTEHTPEETWRLVSFLRHVPQITPVAAPAHDHADHHREQREHPLYPPRQPED
ncbi:MAG TPA: cytochrome c [Vicinamibacterales bacterium]|jgi:mono/diheme cytochrome c family protein|nr:cytochrome c [Vicinamibacterales bacterium]